MGQCFAKPPSHKKQNKDIDDKRMFKVGVSVMEKDFCIQIGFSRRAIKNYNDILNEELSEDKTDGEGYDSSEANRQGDEVS